MKRYLLAAMTAGMALTAVHAEYTLKITRGKFPDDVKLENLNGNVPIKTAYATSRGWTDQGWTVGDYGQRMNVGLAPSYLAGEGVCESSMTLPPITICEGEWLSWEGCEVYPVFSEEYTVEFRPTGSDAWTTLGEYSESDYTWSRHMLDLSALAGTEGELRFVCRSSDGYMLALSDIVIATPTKNTFVCTNHTPKFFGLEDLEEGAALTEISILNTGIEIDDAEIGLKVGDDMVATFKEPATWDTGETRSFSLPLPLSRDERCAYEITIATGDGEPQTLGESFAYCSSFKRHLYVDKGTGMWCNSCPSGTILMEEMETEYGDALIAVETHNNDPLANDIDFSWLKFYAIPYFRLNRIESTQGDGIYRFNEQICIPTEMDINVMSLTLNADGTLTAEADVRTSEEFVADGTSYRIGYTLTHDVSGKGTSYYQQNNCIIARYRQYRYLPSRIPADLCWFPDVSLPSPVATAAANPAFTGVEDSLPEVLEAGSTYSGRWDILLPDGYDDFSGMRLVAFVLDTNTRAIINSIAVDINSLTGVETIDAVSASPYATGVFSIDGRRIDTGKRPLAPGLYIVDGKKTLIR